MIIVKINFIDKNKKDLILFNYLIVFYYDITNFDTLN